MRNAGYMDYYGVSPLFSDSSLSALGGRAPEFPIFELSRIFEQRVSQIFVSRRNLWIQTESRPGKQLLFYLMAFWRDRSSPVERVRTGQDHDPVRSNSKFFAQPQIFSCLVPYFILLDPVLSSCTVPMSLRGSHSQTAKKWYIEYRLWRDKSGLFRW